MLSSLMAKTSCLLKGAAAAVASFLTAAAARLPGDAAVVAVFQFCVLVLGLWAALGSIHGRELGFKVTRGEEGWGALTIIYGALTGLAITLVTTAEADWLKERRSFFILLDTIVLLYVVLINDWSRNKILGVWISLRTEYH